MALNQDNSPYELWLPIVSGRPVVRCSPGFRIYLQGGDLVARAIPNPDQESDPVPMITGGIKSNKRFGFTYVLFFSV